MAPDAYSWHEELVSSHLSPRWLKTPMRDPKLTSVFIGMQIFGWVGLTLMLWTVFLAKEIRRHPVWINFCLAWMLSCVSYVLLFLAGELNNENPTHQLCLIQASLVNAAPSMTSSAMLALIIHLWFNVRITVFKFETEHQRIRDIILLLMPYVPAVTFFTGVLYYGIKNPTQVKLAECWMYCTVAIDLPGKASAIYVATVLTVGIGIEAVIVSTLHRHWRSYTRSSRHSFAMIIRVVLFTFYGILAIAMSFIYLLQSKHGAVANLFIGLLPVMSVIIFGSQLDIFYTWFFCLQKPIVEERRYRNITTRPLLLQPGSALSSASSLDDPVPPTREAYHHHPSRSYERDETDITETPEPPPPARPVWHAGDRYHRVALSDDLDDRHFVSRSFTV